MKSKTVISKKLLPLLLVVLLLASVLNVTALAGPADAQISVGTAEAAAGSSVTLPVTVSQNPGFAGIGLEFSFDKEVLTLSSVSSANGDGTAAIISMETDLSTGRSTYYNDQANVIENGVLCYLTFTVSESAAAGTYPVSVGLIDSKASNFVNFELENVAVDFTSGSVTVPAPEHVHTYEAGGFCPDDDAYDPEASAYTVTAAGQFKAVAAGVNAGDTFEGKTVTLGADIDLGGEEWTPIGDASNAFAGTFDGAGKSISGLSITNAAGGYKGLFGNVGAKGTVRDFSISGSIGSADAYITSGADNIGGTAGYNGGTVSGITSDVKVFINTGSIYAAGGIVGQNGDDGVISQCINRADVYASKASGGVCGRSYGTITECVNTGNVTGNQGGKDGIGGITGLAGMKDAGGKDNLVSNCYNTGTISNNGGRWHGGIAGFAEHAAVIQHCYDIGQINSGYSWNWNPIIGHVDGGSSNPTASDNYSLKGLNAGDSDAASMPLTIGTVKTSEEFKSAEMIALLGDAFCLDTGNINGGYPVLKWQGGGDVPTEDFIIEASDFADGVFTLTEPGEYTVAADAAGIIRITVTGAVKLTGGGEQGKLANLSIQYTTAGADLTIRDLWIDRPESSNTVPVIDFVGTGNRLFFSGQNYLQCSNSYGTASADIHVGPEAEVTIDGDGELSMYAGSGGSCIGGADTESNGAITINGGTIYAYSSRAASTIGSGQKVDAAGAVTINGGQIYLFANARGACIGSGGMSSSQVGNGAPVTVTGGNLTNYVSFTGSAIGNGGGQAAANNMGLDPAPDPGTLTVSGGSVKTVMLQNSLQVWGLEGSGNLINDIAITAAKKNPEGKPVYLLILPLAEIEANGSGDPYVVLEGGGTLYSGDQSYDYTANTRGIWTDKTSDANLYLYLSGEEHTLSVNGTELTYAFSDADNTFSLKEEPADDGWNGTVDTSWYNTTDTSFTLSSGSQLAGLAAIVNGTAEGIEQDSFKGKTVTLGADIDLGATITDSETSYTVTVLGGGTKTYTLRQPAEGSPVWTPIGSATYAFKGTFDGAGHKIENLYVSADTSYLGLFGSVGGTDAPGASGYGVVKNFRLYGLVENTNPTGLATDYVGAVAGKLNAGGTICDVINYADVEAKNTANVGGIAGFGGTPVNGANDGKYTDNPSGYNTFILRCGNEGLIHGWYKMGGIVGENASTVMYCYNNGFILPHMHGSGGGWGGISGRNGNNNAATEESVIAYCYNTGTITNDGMNDDKNETIKGYTGISGMNYGGHGRNEVHNCYNVGAIAAGRNNYNSIATNVEGSNKAKMIHDNYSLICSWIKNNSNPETAPWETGIQIEESAFKATTYNDGDILTLLGPYFTADTGSINSGYPVLRWQVGKALPTPTSLSVITAPAKTEYSATQTFDPSGMVVKAVFDDGSAAIVSSDVAFSTDPLTAGTESVTLTYSFNGATVTATQAISVSNLSLSGIEVTAAPTKTIYAAGESLDKTGMVVTASFNDGAVTRVLDAEEYTVIPETLTAGQTEVTISYTYASVSGDETKTAAQAVKVMEAFPEKDEDGFYLLEDADDMLWFSNQVGVMGNRTIKGRLANDIDLSEADWQPIGGKLNAAGTSFTANANTAYLGEFDGNGKTLTFAINVNGFGYRGVFAYLGSAEIDGTAYTAYVHDLTVAGSVTATGSSYVAGVAAYSNAAVIENCVNKATITSSSSYTAGIAGYVQGGGRIVKCENQAAVSGGTNVGGIAAYVNNGIVKNCKNTGNTSGGSAVGGIAGYAGNTASEFAENANLGAVTGTSNNVGGIIGQAAAAMTVTRCFNTGAIEGSAYVGGIAGTCSALVTDCYNWGTVKGTSTSANVYMAAGGIAGSGGANSSYANTYNSGEVTAENGNASGIVGASNNAAFTITNSYWLEGTAAQAYLERTEGKVTATDVGTRTSEELQALAGTLGENFSPGETFPILTWQALKEQVETVKALIDAIDEEITAESEDGITAARAAYDALSEAQKAEVTNYADLVAAEEALERIKSVPVIDSQTAEQTLKKGETVELKVSATGVDLTYQWQYSKNNGETWTDCKSTGFDQDTFTFKATAGMDGRLYRCIVTGAGGTAESEPIPVKVSTLAISVQPKDAEVGKGQTVDMTVKASGKDLTYQWQYSKDSGKTWVDCKSAGYDTAALSFKGTATMNGRRFRCVVTDGYGFTETSEAAQVTVSTTAITSSPADMIVTKGTKITVKVAATGTDLTYQWQYSKNGGKTWVDCQTAGYNTESMSFKASATMNGRQFRCIVTGADGIAVASAAGTLTVTDTAITAQPADVTVAAGKKATFKVTATGEELTYQWQYSKNGGKTWIDCTSAGHDSATFSFKPGATLNGRLYRCVVTGADGVGLPTEAATLTVQ